MALAGRNAALSPLGPRAVEVRTDLPAKRAARVLLCLYRERLVALHGFIKKTRTTPEDDLTLARKRQKELQPMSKKHMGSSIDDFLKAEGILEEAQAEAVKELVAWQLAEAMKTKKISKARMARLLQTSRTQVDRLLDPKNDVTLSSLQRAAAMVGRRVRIELV
jgi:hypothetical protein